MGSSKYVPTHSRNIIELKLSKNSMIRLRALGQLEKEKESDLSNSAVGQSLTLAGFLVFFGLIDDM